ncbi:MAG: D-amino acid aminotransferase [Pseudomonadota bacterium]
MTHQGSVYLNGEFLPLTEAKVSVLDRGFIFGDGIYEVIPAYGARLFRLPHHLQRLDQGLAAIHLANPLSHSQWQTLLDELIELNDGGDQSLYLQITRGVAERNPRFPVDTQPTVFAMSTPIEVVEPQRRQGIHAVTVEDIRWKLCHIKTISLLPNILLRQQALDAGADEAIILRDGEVTEGTASNIFIVRDGVVITPPKGQLLLPGITRDLVMELCQRHNIPCEEQNIDELSLREADEIWLTSSTREIIPVIELDQQPLANGRPGPMWEKVIHYYQAYKQAFREGREE